MSEQISQFDLATYLDATLASLEVDRAVVFLAWRPSGPVIQGFDVSNRLKLAQDLREPTNSTKCVVFCGSNTLLGFRRLIQWRRDGVRRLIVFAAPGVFTDQSLGWWLRRAARDSGWRRVPKPWSEWVWSRLHSAKLRSLIGADRSGFLERSQSIANVLAIESIGRGGAEKQILLRASDLSESGESVVVLINDTHQARVASQDAPCEIVLQESIGSIFESGQTLWLTHDEGTRNIWQSLLGVLPADFWQATYLAAVALKALAPQRVITYLDWTNATSGLAAVLCRVPQVVMSFRNVAPFNFAFHRFEYLAIYRAMTSDDRVTYEANSEAGCASYARWLGVPTDSIVYRSNYATPNPQLGVTSSPSRGGVVGWLGRFASEKDPHLWLRSTLALCRDFPSARGVMVGQGPLFESVGDAVDQMGAASRLKLRQSTSEPEVFLADIDVLLVTSRHEGSPNVLAESAQAGTPVVCTEAGDARRMSTYLPDVVVVKGRDPEVLAAAITNMGVA